MKTAVARTSIDAFAAFMLGPELPRQQRAIVEFLSAHPGTWTRAEIAERTGMRLSSVTGRVHELMERRVIVERGRRPCSTTGIVAHLVALAPLQQEMFAA